MDGGSSLSRCKAEYVYSTQDTAVPNFSVCLEMLFVDESEDFLGRLKLLKATGLSHFEFWRWSRKDLVALGEACEALDLRITACLAEPTVSLTDRALHGEFIDGLGNSIAVAQRLGIPILIVQAGSLLDSLPREVQRENLIMGLAAAAEVVAGTGVRLAVEPLNTRVDHAGYFLDSTAEALDILDAVGRSEVGLLYDLYHSMVMGEVPQDVLAGRAGHILHVHVADYPGRNQPGTGTLPLAESLRFIEATGFRGSVGLEFRPVGGGADAITQAIAALSPGLDASR